MINNVTIVGRLANDLELGENGKVQITLSVPKATKDENGEYGTNFVDVLLVGSIAQHTIEYCKKGDLMGVRGRIETTFDTENDFSTRRMIVVAEKVTFLATTKGGEDNEK